MMAVARHVPSVRATLNASSNRDSFPQLQNPSDDRFFPVLICSLFSFPFSILIPCILVVRFSGSFLISIQSLYFTYPINLPRR